MERLNILDEFNEFLEEDKELIRLEPVEDRSDDLGTSSINGFDSSILSLFILSQRTSISGFTEKYMLSKKDVKRLKILRNMLEEDSTLSNRIINAIESSLSNSYSKFLKYRDLRYFQLHDNEIKLEEQVPKLRQIK